MHHHSSFIQHRRSGSPTIPLHLLDTSPVVPRQLRHYSSESQRGLDDPPQREPADSNSTDKPNSTSGFASTFGFQSLKGLFHQPPPRNRYSRPREIDPVKLPPTSQSSVADSRKDEKEHGAQPRPSSTSSSVEDMSDSGPSSLDQSGQDGFGFSPGLRKVEIGPSVESGSSPISKVPSTRVAKFFASDSKHSPNRSKAVQAHRARGRMNAEEPVVQRSDLESAMPWGLPQEYSDTIESFANLGLMLQDESKEDSPSRDSGSHRPLAKDQVQEVAPETLPSPQTLTHVNTSGEARMVDVGAKPATKRTAIACAYVGFTNSEPFRLIFENANKKGDVLGVARVAGIMGAKRTSELIPLCHPIPITKVDVDVALVPPNSHHPLVLKGSDNNGAVAIEALVECTGPTGVEMEALTAANVAAMTVYDMCKAVDHLIRIYSVQVVYKSGGKSGLHVFRNWAGHRGPKWFAERGLEYPDFKDNQSPTTMSRRAGSSKTP